MFALLTRALVAAACMVSAASAQSPKRLWTLQEPDELVEYDATTFAARRTQKVPRRLVEHPEYLGINAKGQLVFLPPKDAQWAGGEMASAGGREWLWDGRQAKEWKLVGRKTHSGASGKNLITETVLECFLSAGGDSLFWFENKFEKVLDDSGVERSVRAASRLWRAGLAGGKPEPVMSLSPPEWCECTTGTCSESCPEWIFWAPDGIVGDFFLLTRYTPGQIGTTYHESLLYQRTGRVWQAKKLPQPVERPLAASERGEALVAASPDGGCCGWENEGNDRTLLRRNGAVAVLFDEFGRYDNSNYDVSFYTENARLSAGGAMLAYTVVTTASPERPIRLSSGGKENAAELARVRAAIAGIPAVEILRLGGPPRPAAIIPHAALVGWLSDREILVAQSGRLAVYDIRGSKRRETAIRVRGAADAFLRQRVSAFLR